MEPRHMHQHVPGAAPIEPVPPTTPPTQEQLSEPLPGPDPLMWPEPQPEQPIETIVPDTPKAAEIKAELAHLDEIEATLPVHHDDPDEIDGDDEPDEHGKPKRKKRHK